MAKRGIALLSGGLDSTVALWKVKDSYEELHTLTFSYGAKDEGIAIKAARKLSSIAGAEHRVIELPWLKEFSIRKGSALVSETPLPEPAEEELDDIKSSAETAKAVWVPARNLVFIAIAASYAEALSGSCDIIAGFDLEEARTFPDNSEEFVSRANTVLELSTLAKDISLIAPLIHNTKAEIAYLANQLSVPYEFSSSCYSPLGVDEEGRPVHCGLCESCARRRRGFRKAGFDRTVYASSMGSRR